MFCCSLPLLFGHFVQRLLRLQEKNRRLPLRWTGIGERGGGDGGWENVLSLEDRYRTRLIFGIFR